MELKTILLAGLFLVGTTACGSDDDDNEILSEEDNTEDTSSESTDNDDSKDDSGGKTYDMTGFAKGADVSWLTEMEASNYKFYTADGVETECMTLLRDLGVNSIRLRVWVNPSDGWCNKSDVVTKAVRANELGMRVMIDFHYSDTWADPSKQYKPASWEGLSLAKLKEAITDHTKDVLNALKDNGVTPEWVQVGNEVGPGMLWDTDATISGTTYDIETNGVTYKTNQQNFADFITTGCEAVKAVCPNAKVVVHLQNGQDNYLFIWIFDILKTYNADYDVIGMSLYPETTTWRTMTSACVSNMKSMISRYGKEVMVCEVGMSWDEAITAKSFLTELITQSKAIDGCLGVFYWEPECYNSWKGYTKGAFDNSGKPTAALDAFSN